MLAKMLIGIGEATLATGTMVAKVTPEAVVEDAASLPVEVENPLCGAIFQDDTDCPCILEAGHVDRHKDKNGLTWLKKKLARPSRHRPEAPGKNGGPGLGALEVSKMTTDKIKKGETVGLWRKRGMGGKYLVQRRDGTVPEWPGFVIGAKDPAAPAALRAYANEAEKLGFDARYVADMRELADDFDAYRKAHGEGDPTAPPHRKDDPAIIAKIAGGTM